MNKTKHTTNPGASDGSGIVQDGSDGPLASFEIRVEERETARASSGTEARVDGGIVVEISGP